MNVVSLPLVLLCTYYIFIFSIKKIRIYFHEISVPLLIYDFLEKKRADEREKKSTLYEQTSKKYYEKGWEGRKEGGGTSYPYGNYKVDFREYQEIRQRTLPLQMLIFKYTLKLKL